MDGDCDDGARSMSSAVPRLSAQHIACRCRPSKVQLHHAADLVVGVDVMHTPELGPLVHFFLCKVG